LSQCPPQEFFLPADKETEAVMNLLFAYVGILLAAQALAVGAGLIVDRLHSSHGGLLVFIALYFTMFWVAWKIAVRITRPKSSIPPQQPGAA
jgi:hypothetical protein